MQSLQKIRSIIRSTHNNKFNNQQERTALTNYGIIIIVFYIQSKRLLYQINYRSKFIYANPYQKDGKMSSAMKEATAAPTSRPAAVSGSRITVFLLISGAARQKIISTPVSTLLIMTSRS